MEKVLVIARKDIPFHLPKEGIIKSGIVDFIDYSFDRGVLKFLSREEAEISEIYKQIIPYVIMCHNDKILSYRRTKTSGEKRLVGNMSIGIGGHINPCDTDNGMTISAYVSAISREISEEIKNINISNEIISNSIVGLINDETNAVGSVHLGIIHLINLVGELNISSNEESISDLRFLSKEEIDSYIDEMETWSKICIRNRMYERLSE